MKTAENLCFGFGCWGKDFFAKVSSGLKFPPPLIHVRACIGRHGRIATRPQSAQDKPRLESVSSF